MDETRLREGAERDQLWASLRALEPEIQALANGTIGQTARELQLIQLVARIVASELRFRAEQAESE